MSNTVVYGYDINGFDKKERKIKELCDKIDRRSVKFLLSNSATDFIWTCIRIIMLQLCRHGGPSTPKEIEGKLMRMLVKNCKLQKHIA